MSTYGHLICNDCRVQLWLGKALIRNDKVFNFHIGEESSFNFERPILNKVLWKFLAEHT